MKTKSIVLLLAACAFSFTASAAEKPQEPVDHKHEKKVAGPNGGRILTAVEPHAEFFVTADRKVQITFLGEDGKAIAPAGQVVTVTTGDRSAPTTMTFAKSGKALVSNVALPAGNDLPAVVQIKQTPDAKAVIERFNVDLSKCGECEKPEYACACH